MKKPDRIASRSLGRSATADKLRQACKQSVKKSIEIYPAVASEGEDALPQQSLPLFILRDIASWFARRPYTSGISACGSLAGMQTTQLTPASDPKRTLRSGGNGVIAHHIRFKFEFIKSVF